MSAILVLPDARRVPVVDGLLIGRVAPCDVTLADTKSSRKHARLRVEGTVVEIEDLDSSNGTFLNGERVKRRVLRPGDQIQIGTTVLRFEAEADAGGVPPGVEPVPGEDLFGGDDGIPGADLEGDPRTGFIEPSHRPSPPSPPPPAAPPPASSTVAGGDDVEVLEFVDEVVEVRKPPPERPAAPSAPRPRAPAAAAARSGGVLQFQKQGRAARRGVLGDDMAQMSVAARLGLVVLALAVAGGLGYLAMLLAS